LILILYQKMKKICHITTVAPAINVRIFHKECKTLVQAGYDVFLIGQHPKEEVLEGIKIIPLPKPKNRFYRILILNIKAYNLARKLKADVYHFHDPEFLLFGALLKSFQKSRVIYEVFENFPLKILHKYWIPKYLRKPISFIFKVSERFLLRFFDYVIVHDDFLFSIYHPILKNENKLIVIKNFPPIEKFNLKKYKKRKNAFICIYVGGLSEERGLFKMVKALEYIDFPINLYLFGNFDKKEEFDKLKTLKGFEKVKYFGQRPWDEVIRYLSNADVGLVLLQPLLEYLPSGEGLNKLFEYMMAGLPVIASNFPNLIKIVEGNKCGLTVDPTDPKQIAEAIKYIKEHPDEAKRMGENGKKAVLEKYNWENESKKLLKIYEELTR
jgi:glycosyltransferase involved in cell wall biosynthesis